MNSSVPFTYIMSLSSSALFFTFSLSAWKTHLVSGASGEADRELWNESICFAEFFGGESCLLIESVTDLHKKWVTAFPPRHRFATQFTNRPFLTSWSW